MADLRLINLLEDGEVEFTADFMDKPLSAWEESLQRVVMCILNTPGTMIDAPGWGGGAMGLWLKTRRPSVTETKHAVAEVVHRAQESLIESEPPGPYRVVALHMVDLTRKERGYNVVIRVDFAEAASSIISIPGAQHVPV